MAFRCVIVTPERQILDESASQVILPAFDGLIGILTDRSPLLAKLGVGLLRIDIAGGAQRRYLIEGGIAQMIDNRLTILTDAATPPEELNLVAARADFAAATALPSNDEKSYQEREKQLARARARQQLASAR